MIKKITVTVASVCALALSALAQISVQVPSVVALDEQFNLVFVIEGSKPSSFDWQCPSDFKLVWGPQTGSSTSISIVNGKRTTSTQTSYTYILMPTAEGSFTLPAATARIGGKSVTSKQPAVKVVKSGAASASSTPSQQNAYTVSGEDLFLRLDVSRRNVVMGEPFTAAIKLYQRVNIAGYEDFRLPSFDGFWSQVEAAPSEIEFHRETVGDQIFNVATLRSYTLIPQQSGDLVIDPAELVCVVRIRNRSSAGSLIDNFFRDDYSSVRKRVATKSTTIHVSPLPQPQPESFCGGVGKFSVRSVVSKDSLATHDASSLVVTVTGKGNIALIQAPKVKFPPDFEVYDVKSGDKDGARVFEYPFIPRHYGEFVIPPVEFSYYDTSSGGYVTVKGEPLHIKVSRSASDAQPSGPSSQSFSGVAGADIRNLGSDIRYISTGNPGLKKAGNFFVGSPLFLAILVLLFGGALALWLALRGLAARRADVSGERRRSASKMARARLARSGAYLADNLYSAFYEELHRALLGFIADKFGLEASSQDRDNISSALLSAGVSQAYADEFLSLLDACDYARYAPDAGHEAMDAHYKSALEVISAIDDSMKKRKNGKNSAAAALIALLLCVPFAGSAAETDPRWQAGVEAYAAGDWAEARSQWQSIVDAGFESAPLLTNLGSACFKEGDLAHAILYYEKALKVDPSYEDARYNLEFSRTFLKDRTESVPEFFVATWIRSLRQSLSADVWAVCFLVLLAGALALALLFLLGRSSAARKAGFFAGLVALLLSLVCLGFSLRLRAEYSSQSSAIVVAPVTVVRSAPDNNTGTDLFVLHEGTKIKMLDSVGSWTNISLSDGRQGWILSKEIEII